MLHDVITSAPRTHGEVHNEDWQKDSLCYRLIEEAEEREKTEREQSDFELAARYFLREFPDMPNDTRGSILATYGVMADVLLRGHMADLFDGETNFLPDLTFDGAVIVLDLPTKVYGQAGVYVQSAFTYLWQTRLRAARRKAYPRDPCSGSSMKRTSWCAITRRSSSRQPRSARVASVLISQNKPNYLAAMGGEVGTASRRCVPGQHGHQDISCERRPGNQSLGLRHDLRGNADPHQLARHDGSRTGQGRRLGSAGAQGAALGIHHASKKAGRKTALSPRRIVYQTGASFAGNEVQPWLRTSFDQQIPGVTGKPVTGIRNTGREGK